MKYWAKEIEKHRLKKLARATSHYYCRGAYYSDIKGRYLRSYTSRKPGNGKYWRRVANRKVRRSNDVYQNGEYKRLFDYWWTLW